MESKDSSRSEDELSPRSKKAGKGESGTGSGKTY